MGPPPRNSTSSTSPRGSAARSAPISRRCCAAGEAPNIRATLEQRGVVFFRGLDITDEQQVAIARTLGPWWQNEGEDGIYKISLDETVNQRAKYLKGSLFWHFDGSLQPYPNLATLLRAVTLSETGGQTEFCNTYAAYDDLPNPTRTSSPIFGWCTARSGRSTT